MPQTRNNKRTANKAVIEGQVDGDDQLVKKSKINSLNEIKDTDVDDHSIESKDGEVKCDGDKLVSQDNAGVTEGEGIDTKKTNNGTEAKDHSVEEENGNGCDQKENGKQVVEAIKEQDAANGKDDKVDGEEEKDNLKDGLNGKEEKTDAAATVETNEQDNGEKKADQQETETKSEGKVDKEDVAVLPTSGGTEESTQKQD